MRMSTAVTATLASCKRKRTNFGKFARFPGGGHMCCGRLIHVEMECRWRPLGWTYVPIGTECGA